MHVALAKVRSKAGTTTVMWRVEVKSVTPVGAPPTSKFDFHLELEVGDSQGVIDAISYVAFFIP
jgi:hypothetical protein